MPADSATVHIVHRDAVMAAGLRAILAACPALRVSAHPDRPDALAGPGVTIADYETGVALARQRGQRGILIVTQLDREWDVRRAMEAGVHGFLLQSCSPDELHEAVAALLLGRRFLSAAVTRSVADSLGREHLTGRETEVLQLLAEGCCNKTIARRLGIGVGTVKTHVKGVMSKLDATARTHAVVVATQRGLVRPGAGDGASCAR